MSLPGPRWILSARQEPKQRRIVEWGALDLHTGEFVGFGGTSTWATPEIRKLLHRLNMRDDPLYRRQFGEAPTSLAT